jgi:hypothetical protein
MADPKVGGLIMTAAESASVASDILLGPLSWALKNDARPQLDAFVVEWRGRWESIMMPRIFYLGNVGEAVAAKSGAQDAAIAAMTALNKGERRQELFLDKHPQYKPRYAAWLAFDADWQAGKKDVTKMQAILSELKATQDDVSLANEYLLPESDRFQPPSQLKSPRGKCYAACFSDLDNFASRLQACGLYPRQASVPAGYEQGELDVEQATTNLKRAKDFDNAAKEVRKETDNLANSAKEGLFELPTWLLVAGGVALLGVAGVYVMPAVIAAGRTINQISALRSSAKRKRSRR